MANNFGGFKMIRIGNGYDVHALVSDRKLILGGVEIPFKKGLLGHSDGDVLVHAIIDSLLGALGERDIGCSFPDNDMAYKDILSLLLLKNVGEKIIKSGYLIGNIDSIIVAEKPKVSGFIDEMKKNIAFYLGIEESRINIKATTTEGLGFTGRGEGISSYAVACIYKK